jgi:hypothetical protein
MSAARIPISDTQREKLLALLKETKDADLKTFATDLTDDFEMTEEEQWYLDQAREGYHVDGKLELEHDSMVSIGDDKGAYVLMWRWVPGLPPEKCSEGSCEERGDGVESTPCGSFCEEHLRENVKDCEVCRAEFPEYADDGEDEENPQ